MMLRIGIDGRALHGNRSGIGRYVFELCKELDVILPDSLFFVYSKEAVELPVVSERWIARIDQSPVKKFLKSEFWLKVRCGSMCRKDNLNVFWGAVTLLPRLPHSVKTVLTVYDLNHLIVPNTMKKSTLFAHKLFFGHDIKNANQIIAISKGTSDKLLEYYDRAADSIVAPSVSSLFFPQPKPVVDSCLSAFDVKQPYVLAVASWEPRKNLELLIAAFIYLKQQRMLPDHQLVLVGGRGWKDGKLASLITRQLDGWVKPLGYIEECNLPALYSGADFFVFPSSYEGFGIPVLEAMVCGTLVITTDIPELREAGGSSAIYIKPTIKGICDGLMQATKQLPKQQPVSSNFATWRVSAEILAQQLVSVKKDL